MKKRSLKSITTSRRDFLKLSATAAAGMGLAQPLSAAFSSPESGSSEIPVAPSGKFPLITDPGTKTEWPVLKRYDQEHTYKIALPVGGIGTGSISLGGRGNLQDWEIMNKPAKGFNPSPSFFSLYTEVKGKKDVRLLEGPVPFYQFEGASGAVARNHGFPRFENVTFEAAYPFGTVNLETPQLPIRVKVKAFNPLIPADIDNSSIPVAIIDFELTNNSGSEIPFSICGTIPNFIFDGSSQKQTGKNINTIVKEKLFSGIHYTNKDGEQKADEWGEFALASTSEGDYTYRTGWKQIGWGSSLLDFHDDIIADGKLDNRIESTAKNPIGSLAVSNILPAGGTRKIRFLIAWYFPNRTAWSSEPLKNYYSTKYNGVLDVLNQTVPALPALEAKTVEFVASFLGSDLPEVVKESALFNLSTLKTQTCFRLSDGNFFAWEGCNDKSGCCFGSCTHVWNYETAIAFLYGDLAKNMRSIEFGMATGEKGLMSFRVSLPVNNIMKFGKVAADGQMGCIIKMYREWQLSGDNEFLKTLYPHVKDALSYAWIPGGWDGNQDGVMEGVQHNTMDVEYYGPNPQMTIWYLGALRAMEEMAIVMKDKEMAAKCRKLFLSGSKWADENLFNGEYYVHKIVIPDKESIPKEQLVGMGATDYGNPDYQLGEGCLVDQLVGQYLAHVCGLGYLVKKENVAKTLQSIMKYNYREDLSDHFNCMRSFALDKEAALLMASYPKTRPANPFPYFTEVMTGFEYTAAVGMLYEGQIEAGLKCIKNVRDRYDGRRRSPFDEAECGHHYGRAMASWSELLALTGFNYSGVTGELKLADNPGKHFWSNGYAYGTAELSKNGTKANLAIEVLGGKINISKVTVEGREPLKLKQVKTITKGTREMLII
jgi:uncharacterized protein (DUF608 family)